MIATPASSSAGARRNRALTPAVDRLESRQLLSAAPTAHGHAAAEVHRPTPPRTHADLGTSVVDTSAIGQSATAQAPATATNTYFFALQQLTTLAPGAVLTIKEAQDAFRTKFPNPADVQINDPNGLHISVVRLGDLTADQAATVFASAQAFVTAFVNMNGNVNFHFLNTTPAKLRTKDSQFVAYNVYLTHNSTDFDKFAKALADAVGINPSNTTGPDPGQPHVSILHYSSSVQSGISTLLATPALQALTLTLDYTPTNLYLLETQPGHQYQVATVNGHQAVINLQPK